MNNLIEERDERTRKRKKKKRKMDSIIGLGLIMEGDEIKNTLKMSASMDNISGGSIRLLDEGYCDQGFVIKKGTLEKYLNGENQYVRGYEMGDDGDWKSSEVLNMTDDFEGHVNVGHQDFATYPIIVGKWKRSDLSLVDIENDRKGLDIALKINEDLNVVKDLKAMPYDIGVSAEFYYHINEKDTEELTETLGEYIPVIDEIFIFAYGLVGECGNVNSSGLELKGEAMSKEKILNAEDQVKALADDTDVADVTEDITEEPTDKVTEEPVLAAEDGEPEGDPKTDAPEEPVDDDVSEEPSADEDEGDDDGDEASDDLKDEGGVDEDDIDEDEADEAALSFDDLLAQIATLTAEVERLKDIEGKYVALKKSHRRLNRKLEEEKQAKADFFEKTKHLSTELFENEGAAEKEEAEEAMKRAKEREYYKGDGIAD